MISNKRRLGTANSLLTVLEPNGGFQPSQVTRGSRMYKDAKNVTDEDAMPEIAIQKNNRYDSTVAFTPEILEALASSDEISDLLDRLTSYIAIQPDLGSSFAYADLLPTDEFDSEFKEKLITDMQRHWQIAQDLMFASSSSRSLGIKQFLLKWLTYGTVYIGIIRETINGKVIDMHVQFTPFTEQKLSNDEHYWKTDLGQFIWEQEDVFVLDFSEINPYIVSYVGGLMRSYNLFKTIERTRIANAIMSAQFRSVYTVPTAGLGKVKARQKLSTIMALYKRDVRINDSTGQVTVNGENSYPVNTEIWTAETSSGAVKIDTPSDGNVNLNSMDMPEYFMRRVYKKAKMPMSKYEAVDASYLSGLSNNDEDDRQFALYIQSIRTVLSKLFCSIIWRLMQPIKDYVGRNDIPAYMTLSWYNEPEHKTPEDVLDGISETFDKIQGVLDKYKEQLTECGFASAQIQARLNVLRVKLMRKFCPDMLEQTLEDYSNVPEEEQTDNDTANDSDFGDDSWDNADEGGTEDFADWGDDDWSNSFDKEDNAGDDWSMPEDSDLEDFGDTEW